MATRTKRPATTPEEARLAARRKKARERKAIERARRDPEQFAAQKRAEDKACLDWDEKLAPHITPIEHGVHAGCWLWRGGYYASYATLRPVVRAGQYGRQNADVAVWLVHHERQRLPPGSFLKRVCGNLRCVSPMEGHALCTNRTLENEKKRRQRGNDHGDLQEQRQAPGRGRIGRQQQGRQLPRAV